jgi:hypothetical protein
MNLNLNKMNFFNFFKTKKNKYQIYYDMVNDILKILERKKHLSEIGVKIDLEFDQLMSERIFLVSNIKNGNLVFLGDDFKNALLEIYNDEELDKEEILHMIKFLENEKQKLKKLL